MRIDIIVDNMFNEIKDIPYSKRLECLEKLKEHTIESNKQILEVMILAEEEFIKRGWNKTEQHLESISGFRKIAENCRT